MPKSWLSGGAAALAVLTFLAGAARAQSSPLSDQELRAKVLELERKVSQLEAERGAKAAPPAKAEATADGKPAEEERIQKIEAKLQKVDDRLAAQQSRGSLELRDVKVGPRGFSLISEDGNFNLRVRGYIQADSHWYTTGSKPPSGSTFLLRRVRPVFEGTVFKFFDYKLMADFGQGAAVIQDAYADAHYYEPASMMVGKFKGPLDFERLVSARDMDFVERALTINLVPNRVLGFQLHGLLLGKRLEYAAGLVNSIPDQNQTNDVASNDAKEFIGRVFVWPFQGSGIRLVEGLGIGAGGSLGNSRGALPKYVTTGQATFFSYKSGITAAGQRFRYEPQFYYHYGPFGLLGEYVENTQSVTSPQTFIKVKGKPTQVVGPVADPLSNQAWQLAASYLITGEEATYLGVKPKRDFNPDRGGWGAFELVARGSDLQVDRNAFSLGFADPTASAREAQEWAIGLNWYLNQNVKFMADYARTMFVGGAAGGHNRGDESTILTRVQIAF